MSRNKPTNKPTGKAFPASLASPASPEAAEYLAGPPADFYIAYPLNEAEREHLHAVLVRMRSEMSQMSRADQTHQTNRADVADEDEIESMVALCETEDATTSEAAFALAEQRAQQRQVSVTVYRRDDIGYDQEYGWIWEDQRVLATIEPDGSGVYYLVDDDDTDDDELEDELDDLDLDGLTEKARYDDE